VPVVDDFRAKLLAAGAGDSQTRQALAVLSGMFTYAEQRERVSRNPVRLVKKPSGKRKRAVVCLAPSTVELARALLLEQEMYGDAALVSLLAYAGPAAAGGPRTRVDARARPDAAVRAEERRRPDRRRPEDQTATKDHAAVAPLRDDLVAWQLRSGRRTGLVFPNHRGEPWSESDWGNWTVRVWKPVREELQRKEPPYGLRHSYASLRIREGASIPELAEELGHSPQMTLGTYTHVIDELRGAPRLPAEQEIARARAEVATRGHRTVLREALG
jgi:integrase